MDKNLLIEIFVPTTRTAGSGRIGTGYPVSKNRILTAYHVLNPEDRDETRSIQVRWYYHKTGSDQDWLPAKINWNGDGTHDIAVIECDFPQNIQSFGALSRAAPDTGHKWESEGFASAGARDDNTRQPVPMKGDTYSPADTASEFELDVDNPPAIPDGWQGVSGSPVFVRGAIIGVVASCPINFNQKRLKATLLRKLFDDPAFLESVGRQNEDYRKEVEERVSDIFCKNPDAVNALDMNLCAGSTEQKAQSATEYLLDKNPEELLKILRAAYETLDKRRLTESSLAICNVVFTIVPFIFDGGVVDVIRAQQDGAKYDVVPLAIATKTVAEIIMANFDRRKASFQQSSGNEKWRGGLLAIPNPPEGGLKHLGETFAKSFDGHLINKFASEFIDDGWQPDEVIKYVSNRLRKMSEKKSTYYFVYNLRGLRDKGIIMQTILEIKKKYPYLVLVCLSEDPDVLLNETNIFDDLLFFLDLDDKAR